MSAFDELQKKQERGEKLTSLEFAVWWCTDEVARKEAAEELAAKNKKITRLKNILEMLEFVENDFGVGFCPFCGRQEPRHYKSCLLDAVLKSENQ